MCGSHSVAAWIEQFLGPVAVLLMKDRIKGFIGSAIEAVGINANELPQMNTGDGAIVVLEHPMQAVHFSQILHSLAQEAIDNQQAVLARYHFRIGVWTGDVALARQTNANGKLVGFEVSRC